MELPYHTPLTPDQQARAGIDPVQALAMRDQVRFSEIDVLHHVNNTRYMEWFERLRIQYVRDWGISQYDSPEDPRIVIRSGAIRYVEEMLVRENYVTTCACAAYRTTSFSLRQQIWAGGRIRATFDCVMVLLNPDGSPGYAIPQAVRQRFVDIDGAQQEG